MKKIIDKVGVESFIGGIFAIIATLAIIAEVIIGGFEPAVIAGGVKDLFGTLITVVMFFVAVRALKPKKQAYSFEEKMTKALDDWAGAHSNMIVKTSKLPKGHENDYGLSMTTDINRFYNTETLRSDNNSGVGRFFRMTEIGRSVYEKNEVEMLFFLNAQTYSASSQTDEILAELMEVAAYISKYIQGATGGINVGEAHKDGDRTVIIPITFKAPIVTEDGDDIDLAMNVIDRMYEAMLVSARRK